MKIVWNVLQRRALGALALAACVTLLAETAFAQVTPAAGYTPPDNTPAIKIGMTLWPSYTFTKSPEYLDVDGNSVHANNFDVGRSYINVTGNINHAVSFRITPDISRMTPSGTGGTTYSLANSLVFRIKYAYAQYSLDDYTGNWKQTWVRIGANQTPFVDWEEGVYRYRFQGTVFSERVGKLTSSDYGISFHTNLPDNYGEIHTGIYNGEGYTSVEKNQPNPAGNPTAVSGTDITSRKSWETRITIRPLPKGGMLMRGLRITGFHKLDQVVAGAPRVRTDVMALFEHNHAVVGFDWLDAVDQSSAAAAKTHGNGYSIWATPIFKQKGSGPEMLLRYDSYVLNRAAPTVKDNRSIVGFAWWFPHEGTVTASLMADFDVLKHVGTAAKTERRIALHGLLNF